jgi:soluble lytic murein transglycosylase-like protein
MLAAADPIDRWEPLIAEASLRFGIPAEWIRAVMRAESAGRTTLDRRPITSSAGAMGLMQVMPNTYRNMRQALGLGGNPYDPHDNIIAGTAFLAAMYNRFGYPGLFAAYNAGPERYDAWLRQGTPLPAETLAYLGAISSDVAESVLAMGAATGPRGSGSTRVANSRPRSEPEV